MTNEQILTVIISATVTAIITSIAKTFAEKIVSVLIPDTRKVMAIMKKIFFFLFRYGPSSFWIFFLIVSDRVHFDKFWVLQLCMNFFMLGVVVSVDTFLFLNKPHVEMTTRQMNIIGDLGNTIKEHNNILKDINEMTAGVANAALKHISVTEAIINAKDNEDSH